MQRLLGLEHPDTLASMVSLAVTLGKQGKRAEAKELEQKVCGRLEE